MKRLAAVLAATALLLPASAARAQAPRLVRLAALDQPAALEAVKRAVGSARIVVLGEPVYGDGGALEAKLHLVRMLHDELGFDVIAFESGQLDMDRVDRAMAQADLPLAHAASQGLLSFWARSTEVDSLLAFVRASRSGTRPITLAGFDVQPSSEDRSRWAKDVIAALQQAGVDDARLLRFSEINRRLHEGDGAAWGSVLPALMEETRTLKQLAAQHRSALEQAQGKERAQLVERSLDDALTFYQLAHEARAGAGTQPAARSARERRMGDNLLWLAHYRFPQRRIIVWLRSHHALYSPAALRDSAGAPLLPGVSTAGSMLRSALGKDVFTLALTAAAGEHGHALERRRHAVPRPAAGSLEAACRALGAPASFADVRGSRGTFLSHLLGYTPVRARWSEQVDAILCLGRTHGVRARGSEAPAPRR